MPAHTFPHVGLTNTYATWVNTYSQVVTAVNTDVLRLGSTVVGFGARANTGSITANTTSVDVIGTGTRFLEQLQVGDIITTSGPSQVRAIVSIVSNVELTVNTAFTTAVSANTFTAAGSLGTLTISNTVVTFGNTSANVAMSTDGALVASNTVTASGFVGSGASLTSIPIATAISGLGTGVATALGVNIGSTGAVTTWGSSPTFGTVTAALIGNVTGNVSGSAGSVALGGITGLGSGIATALGINVGSAGAPILFDGVGGTPSSLTLTNATGLPESAITDGSLLARLAANETVTGVWAFDKGSNGNIISFGFSGGARWFAYTEAAAAYLTTAASGVGSGLAATSTDVFLNFGGTPALQTNLTSTVVPGTLAWGSGGSAITSSNHVALKAANETVTGTWSFTETTTFGDAGGGVIRWSAATAQAGYALLGTAETNTGTGQVDVQAGGGSANYGGSLTAYAHAHASRPGWIVAGISSGSGGKFAVTNQAIGGGTNVFNVDTSGNVVANGTLSIGGGSAISSSSNVALKDAANEFTTYNVFRYAFSGTPGDGGIIQTNAAGTRQWVQRVNTSDAWNLDYYNGSTYTNYASLSSVGILTLDNSSDATLALDSGPASASQIAHYRNGVYKWSVGAGAATDTADMQWYSRTNLATRMTLSEAGLLTVSGFGTHTFSAGGTGAQNLQLRNTTAGTGNYTALFIGNDSDVTGSGFFVTSSTYEPTSDTLFQDGASLQSNRPGGLSLAATSGSGDVRLYSRNALALTLGASQAATFTGAVKVGSLTSGRLTYAGASGLLTDSANLTYDGSQIQSLGSTPGGMVRLHVRNDDAGSTSSTIIQIANNDAVNIGVLQAFSSGYATSGSAVANGFRVLAAQAGGLSLAANNVTTGDVRLYSRAALALTIGASQAATFTGAIAMDTTSYLRGNATYGIRFNNSADTLNLMTLTDAGLLTVIGAGSSKFAASFDGIQELLVRNTSAGTIAQARMRLSDDTISSFSLNWYGGSSAFGDFRTPGSGALVHDGSQGFSLAATHASGAIRVYAGGTSRVAYIGGTAIEFDVRINPVTDNVVSNGASGKRWTEVWAANGTIQTSDRTSKHNIVESDLGLDFIMGLKPSQFTMNDEAESTRRYGLIAQDVISAAQGRSMLGILVGDKEGDYGLNYASFVTPLISSVQTLQARLRVLESRAGISHP